MCSLLCPLAPACVCTSTSPPRISLASSPSASSIFLAFFLRSARRIASTMAPSDSSDESGKLSMGLSADWSEGWSVGLSANRSEGWSVGLLANRLEGWSVGLSDVSLSSANGGLSGFLEGWLVGFSADRSDGLVVPCFALFCLLSFPLFPPHFPLDFIW